MQLGDLPLGLGDHGGGLARVVVLLQLLIKVQDFAKLAHALIDCPPHHHGRAGMRVIAKVYPWRGKAHLQPGVAAPFPNQLGKAVGVRQILLDTR